MKKPIISILIVFAVGTAIFYLTKVNSSTPSDLIGLPPVTNEGIESSSGDLSEVYKEYSETTLEQAQKKGRTLLFFSAIWCPTCKAAKQDLSRNFDKLPDDLTILELDYDTEKELRKRYGVSLQHTFVQIDENGDEITKWIGGGVRTILTNLESI